MLTELVFNQRYLYRIGIFRVIQRHLVLLIVRWSYREIVLLTILCKIAINNMTVTFKA